MKIFFSILFLSIFISTSAQEIQEVKEVRKTFSKGEQNGFSVTIPGAKLKQVISDWKKYSQEKNKAKVKEIDGEYVLPKTVIPDISPDSIKIYLTVSENPTDVQITAFVTPDDVTFYSSATHPGIGQKIQAHVRDFAVVQYRKIVTAELNTEKEKLEDLQEQLEKLEKDNENSAKKIKSNERDNEKILGETKSNKELIELKSDAVLQQKKVMASSIADDKSSDEKKLKTLEKEKKKMEKDNESLFNDMDKNESENKSLQKKIDTNTNENIPAKKTEIEKQKSVVSDVDAKLKAIK